MELSVLTTLFTEPVTVATVKTFVGYPGTDQDTLIGNMITVAREFLEKRTALSFVSKSYKAYYDSEDADDSWFTLPVSPVLDTPAIAVKVNGTATTFRQKGLKHVSIAPDWVIGTIDVNNLGSSYVEVTFQAGATDNTANQIILELTAFEFNHRDDGVGLNWASLPYSIKDRINSITMNL